jgi:phosphoribosylaminoimidazole-succinocarboxamide synthase
LVASDRVSVFDVVLPTEIPRKGQVLTGLSLFWFDKTKHIVDNHLITADCREFPEPFKGVDELAGRAMLVERAKVIRVECVARGYLSGSGWKEYQQKGSVCGVGLPAGLVESDKLPEPIFTPSTKADEGHDLPLTFAETVDMIGEGLAQKLKELTLSLYTFGADYARERGIILADTKYEFGFAEDGELILVDEVMTPDSSRFWPADEYRPGGPQPSYDKQFVRDWTDATGWGHDYPGPALPDDIVEKTTAKYRDAYERITGEPLSAYLERAGAA